MKEHGRRTGTKKKLKGCMGVMLLFVVGLFCLCVMINVRQPSQYQRWRCDYHSANHEAILSECRQMLQDRHSFEPWFSQNYVGIDGPPPSVTLDHNEIDADTWEKLVPDAIREFNPDSISLASNNYVYLYKLWGGARSGFYVFAEDATETERDWLAGVEANDEMAIEYVDGLWFWCQNCKQFDKMWGFDPSLCENSDASKGRH